MVEMLKTLLGALLLLFQPRSRLQVEILVLRQQLIVLRRTAPKRVRLGALDRLLFVLLYRLWPGILIRSPSFGRTRLCAGTVEASEPYGGGSRDAVWADPA
jgi:hypothetical protein